MSKRDAAHSRDGRSLRPVTASLVVLVLLLAGVAYAVDLGPRLGWDAPLPVPAPADVPPPAGVSLPPRAAPPAVAEATPERVADRSAVRRALAGLVTAPALGRRAAVVVDDIGGRSVYRHGPGRVTPASTMKLLTTTAALAELGPDHRFATRVVSVPGSRRIVLVGGGDPLLDRSDLEALARGAARELKAAGRKRIRLGYDASLFTGPAASPHWEASYLPDSVVSPLSALWLDEGRKDPGLHQRVSAPAAAAATAFGALLAQHGVRLTGTPRPMTAGAAAVPLASVSSDPLEQIVRHVLEVSDNEGAEVLARHVAIARDQPASFAGAARAVVGALHELGVSTRGSRILDGSGLSRQDRIAPTTLLDVLELDASADHPSLRPVITGLPVAGFTGSLAYRFDTGDTAGLGRVHAKTGTLTGVHGLAGTVTTLDGVVLGFAAVADRVPIPSTLAARDQLDRIAAALAACTCARTP